MFQRPEASHNHGFYVNCQNSTNFYMLVPKTAVGYLAKKKTAVGFYLCPNL